LNQSCRAKSTSPLGLIWNALIPLLKVGRDVIMPTAAPWGGHSLGTRGVEQTIEVDFSSDCVFFIEAMIEYSNLLKARHRILVPNLWLEDTIVRLAGQCNHIWHKSRMSFERLQRYFSKCKGETRLLNRRSKRLSTT